MKTKCYCIYCKYHPLHAEREKFDTLAGWHVGDWIWDKKYLEQGKNVDCLDPQSDAFDFLMDGPCDFDYPVTAYGDGLAVTGFDEDDLKVNGYCAKEKYEE